MKSARKPIREQVPQHEHSSFHCESVDAPDYDSRWHFHPEAQITLARRSDGYRIVGDCIQPLHDGDCVLVGADVPHVWKQDQGGSRSRVQAIILQFNEALPVLAMPEMELVRKLLLRARRGLAITGQTLREVTPRIEALPHTHGAQRIVDLLGILHVLSLSKELKPLASAGFRPVLDAGDSERMGRVLRYIEEHLIDEIKREEVARVAALSEGAFSRFFHSRTGKTLPHYVNELRIGRACRQLTDSDAPITDVAFDCGFRNLANFNRWFLAITKFAPRDYRRQMAAR
jgi:AraC-like DNA-binding protein